MKIKDVEIFQVGTWNGREFTDEDVDAIVASFEDLNLAGHVPAKLGHKGGGDDAPAMGWIEEIRRKGDKILATLTDVSRELVDGINSGKWRHVSVELLGDVTMRGKKYAWVLDGLAILGAARPAIDSLKGLHEAAMARVHGLVFKQRLAFSREIKRGGGSARQSDDETARLRLENLALTQELVKSQFEQSIGAGHILPRERELFFKRYKDTGTISDAREWISSAPRPDPKLFSREGGGRVENDSSSSSRQAFEHPDDEVTFRAEELMKEEHAKGKTCDLYEATKLLFKKDPDLARRYLNMPSDRWGGR